MAYNNTPNYEGLSLPSFDDMLANMGEGQGLLAGFGNSGQISNFFGFDDKYSKFFNPANIEGIEEGLSQIPALQQYLYNQARQGYGQQRRGLLSQIGKTGMAGTGSFNDKFDIINSGFSSQMMGADKQLQDLSQRYQDQLNQEVGNMYNTAQGLLSGGAKSKGGFGTAGYNSSSQYSNPWDNLSNAYALWNDEDDGGD